MVRTLTRSLARVLQVPAITGPILGKELRVSSRRRRNYVLRAVYVLLLTLFMAITWQTVTGSSGPSVYLISRMSIAGRAIVTTLIWFQFLATQLIAIVMLSSSISDEIDHRTLGVLMTTPITSFQIVVGKLLSKLWQLLILLAISVPVLTIVRIFGGVPWEYVLAGVCITLTSAIFLGSISMYFSIFNRRAYSAILRTFLVAFIVFVFVPGILGLACRPNPGLAFLSLLFYTNPYVALTLVSQMMFVPRSMPGMPALVWQIHCLVMLGASVGILGVCVKVVRRVALRQATGEAGAFPKRKRRPRLLQPVARAPVRASAAAAGGIRRIDGSPIVWRELRTPLLRSRTKGIVGIVVAAIAVLITYALIGARGGLDESGTHVAFAVLFLLVGMICTAVLSATSITSEKESRTWPLLLSTTLSDWHIVFGKAAGVVRRCAPAWIPLAGHMALFGLLARYVHPFVWVHLTMLATWVVVFLTGTGLYFSARLKRTTTAVVANLGLALALWLVLPIILSSMEISPDRPKGLGSLYLCANPVVQAVTVTEAGCGEYHATQSLREFNYEWAWDTVGGTTKAMLGYMVFHCGVGLLFANAARRRLRRNIF